MFGCGDAALLAILSSLAIPLTGVMVFFTSRKNDAPEISN